MAINLPVYMDNHATTPVDPRVLDAMLPYFSEKFGNSASRNHSFGWTAEEAVENARGQVARLINATPKEIIFTSGATESDNLAIKGVAEMYREKGNHIITQVTEHKAVLDTCKRLEKYGYEVTYLPVQKDGRVDLDELRRAITPKTILITIMYANNEIGVIQPIAEIGKIAKEKGVLFHADARAGCRQKFPWTCRRTISICFRSARTRCTGRRASGRCTFAVAIRACNWRPMIDGGGHERGMRSGTLNVPGIVGFGKAAEICQNEMPEETARMLALRDRLKDGLFARLDEVYINGSMEHRLPNNMNISFAFVEGESLLMGINDVAVSSGSACTSATLEPSYVLKALGVGEDLAHTSIRFGLGRFNTEEEVDYVVNRVFRSCDSAARAFAAVRNGQRRRGLEQDELESGLTISIRVIETRETPWRTAIRWSITTIIRATSAACPRTTQTSAPAWSARRNAAT